MGTQQKKKKRTQDTRSVTSEVKRLQDLDVNKLALEPKFEIGYSPLGTGTVDFVNVSTSLGPSQGGSGFPAQVTGLTVTPHAGSDTQLDLAWTATTVPAEFNHYNVYRGPTGFAIDSIFEISEPLTNSYQNTGLTAATTYYYRVSLTNDAALEGPASSQVSGTTSGTAPVFPTLLLHLDNNFTDSATSPISPFGPTGGFSTPGQFGTHYYRCNTPTDMPGGQPDIIRYTSPDATKLNLNLTTGFSISFWIYPTDMSALSYRRVIMEQNNTLTFTNGFSIQLRNDGTVMFFVRKGSVDYKRQKGGFVVNQWQHVAAVFNGATNTVEVYKDGVAGVASTQATELVNYGSGETVLFIGSAFLRDTVQNITETRYCGRLDEIQYFNGSVLSSTQVTSLKDTNAT